MKITKFVILYTLGVLIFAGTNFAIFAKLNRPKKKRIALQIFKGKEIREN